MKMTANTRLNLVIGHPLTHTRSPHLHRFVYQELGIDAVLLAQSHASLEELIHLIKTFSVGLTAVTMPYKEHVIPYLDQCSAEVQALKAANTIIQRDNQLHGYNTDIDGIAFALRNCNVKNMKVLVVGAGGAARAMGYFLQKHHADIFFLNRTVEKADKLTKEFGGAVMTHADCNNHTFDMIVNTTPVGLFPNVHESPISHTVLHAQQIVFDMVYNPVQTTFLKQAAEKQATVISGLDMFIGQGLKQIELLTGKTPTPELIERIFHELSTH